MDRTLLPCGLLFSLMAAATATPARALTIDFDDLSAPCIFAATTALREEYAGLGVHFSGPSAMDGGGVLDQCGGFGINARSEPAFLAFNHQFGDYSDGGRPLGPQTVTFDVLMASVEIFASGGTNQSSFRIDAFRGAGLVASSSLSTIGWAPLAVSDALGIDRIVLTETVGDGIYLFDDLTATAVPEPSTALLLALGLAGLTRPARARSRSDTGAHACASADRRVSGL